MLILITTFKKMIVIFVGECSVAPYVIIHTMSKFYSFASECGNTIPRVTR